MIEYIENIVLSKKADNPIQDVIFPLMMGGVLKCEDALQLATLWSLASLKKHAEQARAAGNDELADLIGRKIVELV